MTDLSVYWADAQTALDAVITDCHNLLNESEESLADDFNPAQRDLIAKAGVRAAEAKKLIDDIMLTSLTAQGV